MQLKVIDNNKDRAAGPLLHYFRFLILVEIFNSNPSRPIAGMAFDKQNGYLSMLLGPPTIRIVNIVFPSLPRLYKTFSDHFKTHKKPLSRPCITTVGDPRR
jgi:hypothetical protein